MKRHFVISKNISTLEPDSGSLIPTHLLGLQMYAVVFGSFPKVLEMEKTNTGSTVLKLTNFLFRGHSTEKMPLCSPNNHLVQVLPVLRSSFQRSERRRRPFQEGA